MTYYDHGTALALKLDRWGEGRSPRNYELEAAIADERAALNSKVKRESVFSQLMKIVCARCKALHRLVAAE